MDELGDIEWEARRLLLDQEANSLARRWKALLRGEIDNQAERFFVEWQARLIRSYHLWVDRVHVLGTHEDYYFLAERYLSFFVLDDLKSTSCPASQLTSTKVRLLSSLGLIDAKCFSAYLAFLTRTDRRHAVQPSLHREDYAHADRAIAGCFSDRDMQTHEPNCLNRYAQLYREAFGVGRIAFDRMLEGKIALAKRANLPNPEEAARHYVEHFYGWFEACAGGNCDTALDGGRLTLSLMTAFEQILVNCWSTCCGGSR